MPVVSLLARSDVSVLHNRFPVNTPYDSPKQKPLIENIYQTPRVKPQTVPPVRQSLPPNNMVPFELMSVNLPSPLVRPSQEHDVHTRIQFEFLLFGTALW